MKSLVTGSSGHLGEALVRSLRAADQPVVGLDLLPSPFTAAIGSITDRQLVRRCMADVHTVFHTATLHKPHIVTHSMEQFVETNVRGTLVLLEEAVRAGVQTFLFTSTTSVFGDANRPPVSQPAAWITEDVPPIPRNIYGVTKASAEELCHLFHRKSGLKSLVLRTSRFFPEDDDNKAQREAFADANAKVNEYLFRRVDIEDVVSAHLSASRRAASIGFGRYIIGATTPFLPEHAAELRTHAGRVVNRLFPDVDAVYERLGWRMFGGIDRVYVNDAARRDLDWNPVYDFRRILDSVREGDRPGSELAALVGAKGYHSQTFEDGPYPV